MVALIKQAIQAYLEENPSSEYKKYPHKAWEDADFIEFVASRKNTKGKFPLAFLSLNLKEMKS